MYYLFIALIYFSFCYFMSQYSQHLEVIQRVVGIAALDQRLRPVYFRERRLSRPGPGKSVGEGCEHADAEAIVGRQPR